ncbi:MAG: cyclodeaminase/cyclohydrolase family protein [Pseudomonadota bacterium]
MNISENSIERFLDDLASAAPTPGGGSAAAIMGAMGAALVSMVCNLTIGKKGYEDVEAEMRAVLAESEALRVRLTAMVADDVAAFDTLMAAYKLPKASDTEKLARSAAIQIALQRATQVPLDCAKACAEVVRLSGRAAEVGNQNVISDAGVGVLAAWGALRSAALNVNINAPSIRDRHFADAKLTELNALLAECGPLSEQVHTRVHGRLG